jgi:hypothetical protein
MTENHIELGRHALGLPNKQQESYRNHFVAGPTHDDYAEWMVMVSEGNAVRLERAELYGGDFCFNLTRFGAEKCLQGKEQLDLDDFRLRESTT